MLGQRLLFAVAAITLLSIAQVISTDDADNQKSSAVASPTSSSATHQTHPLDGVAFDEIIVESSLNVRPKPAPPARRRQQRHVSPLITLIQNQRQAPVGLPQSQN